MSRVRVTNWILSTATLPAMLSLCVPVLAHEPASARSTLLAQAGTGNSSGFVEQGEESGVVPGGGDSSAIVDWLERAARDYQDHIVAKLSVSADAAAAGSRSEASADAAGSAGDWLRSALTWLQSWVSVKDGSSNEAVEAPEAPKAPAVAEEKSPPDAAQKDAPQQVASTERADDSAREFVEARRKAEAAAAEAQRLAEMRDKTAEEKRRAEADAERRKEEADLKAREEARKAAIARQHEENERRIAERLRQLDEAHKAAEEKRRQADEEAKKAADERAALEAEKAALEKRLAEEASRKAAAPVRANVLPELRLPLRSSAKDTASKPAENTPPASAANTKEAAAAANEQSSAQEAKAGESVTAAKAKVPANNKSAKQYSSRKQAKAKRRAQTAKAARKRGKLVYVVKPGDTLSAIAERYLGSGRHYDVIYRANRHKFKDPNTIRAYQRIVIPRGRA